MQVLYPSEEGDKANQMATAITSRLQLAVSPSEWDPPVMLTQAETGEGIEQLWGKIQEHQSHLKATSGLETRRQARRKQEFLETVEEELSSRLKALIETSPALTKILNQVIRKESDPYSAAKSLLDSPEFPEQWVHAPEGNLD